MNLTTKVRVKRSQWKSMVTTEFIIDIMNHFKDKQHPEVPEEAQQPPMQEPREEQAEPPRQEEIPPP